MAIISSKDRNNKADWESNGATRRHTIPATNDVSDNCQSANLDQIQGIRGYLKVIQIITNECSILDEVFTHKKSSLYMLCTYTC